MHLCIKHGINVYKQCKNINYNFLKRIIRGYVFYYIIYRVHLYGFFNTISCNLRKSLKKLQYLLIKY
jgi:hypothetical protein